MKEYQNYECQTNGKYFVIQEDVPKVGWYLKVYNKEMKCISDHLQDDFETIIDFAFDEYGIQKHKWIKR